jgi:hypothetical protein
MSDLKINYHKSNQKSKVIVMWQPSNEPIRIARKLNSKLGAFPFMYLGLPISSMKLTVEQWL